MDRSRARTASDPGGDEVDVSDAARDAAQALRAADAAAAAAKAEADRWGGAVREPQEIPLRIW